MRAARGRCRWCHRHIALTPDGVLWRHGRRFPCTGAGRQPSFDSPIPEWPSRYGGRPVTTVPGPDTYPLRKGAA